MKRKRNYIIARRLTKRNRVSSPLKKNEYALKVVPEDCTVKFKAQTRGRGTIKNSLMKLISEHRHPYDDTGKQIESI